MKPIITSLLDLDYYKLTQGQFVWKFFPDVDVEYAFKNRTKQINLGVYSESINQELNLIRDNIRINYSELKYLESLKIFELGYLDFLSTLRLPKINVRENNGELEITTSSKWADSIYWETIVLSTVNELFYIQMKKYFKEDCRVIGNNKLDEKIKTLKQNSKVKFSDFGTRRRFSREWQKHVVTRFKQEVPNQLLGTSNVKLAMELDLKPIGTMAHELLMSASRLFGDSDEEIKASQCKILDMWYDYYGYDLSIALTDTFGSKSFFELFGEDRAKKWKGMRQDSGSPEEFAKKQLEYYKKFNIDTTTKFFVPSDGLTIDKAVELTNEFGDKIHTAPGIGTSVTNDVGMEPLSIVMKLAKVNGKGTVKLSDNLAKAMGTPEDVERFKNIFGYTNVKSEATIY